MSLTITTTKVSEEWLKHQIERYHKSPTHNEYARACKELIAARKVVEAVRHVNFQEMKEELANYDKDLND